MNDAASGWPHAKADLLVECGLDGYIEDNDGRLDWGGANASGAQCLH
jgi:hypothetical protein